MGPYLQFNFRGMNWILSKEYQNFADKIAELPYNFSVQGDIIKENQVRVSRILSLNGDDLIFVKRYKMQSLGETLKYLFFTPKIKSEWKNILFFHQKGLPTVTPVAMGIKKQGLLLKDSLLVTKYIPHCLTLKEIFGGHSLPHLQIRITLTEKRELIQKLAWLIRTIHEKGIFYRDLHAGNILLKKESSDKFEFFFVDLHKAWYLRKVPYLARIRDLAQLKNSIDCSHADQIRFLKTYARFNDPPLNKMAADIEKYATLLKRVHLKSRTLRCLTNSSEFIVRKGFNISFYGKKKFGMDFFDSILKEYSTARLQDKIKIIKKQNKSSVFLLPLSWKGERLNLCIKEFKYPTLLYNLRSSITRSRALKSWIGAQGLRVRGFLTPEPFALFQERKYGILQRSILISEFLEGIEELNDYILKNFDNPLNDQKKLKKKRFIDAFSNELKRLHSKGIYHPDLKSNNILVRETNGNWQFFFIDLDCIKFKKILSPNKIIKNLSQINASVADCITVSDRLRFFRIYAADTPLFLQRKSVYRKILNIGKKKVTDVYRVYFKKN